MKKPKTRCLIEWKRNDHQEVAGPPAELLVLAFQKLCVKLKINPAQLALAATEFREDWRNDCHNMVVSGMIEIQERVNQMHARLAGVNGTAHPVQQTKGGLIVPLGTRQVEEEPEENASDEPG